MVGDDLLPNLARLALFADLRRPALEAVAHTYLEEVFAPGQRVLRQDIAGGGLYVILDGEAVVELDGEVIAVLGRGDFFGEISVLNGETPSADVRAEGILRCFVIPADELEPFLLKHPRVMLRMLQAEALRLRDTTRWE
jgi:CRP/FNR family transcriptional regulator, cyclic AMP receptor protein